MLKSSINASVLLASLSVIVSHSFLLLSPEDAAAKNLLAPQSHSQGQALSNQAFSAGAKAASDDQANYGVLGTLQTNTGKSSIIVIGEKANKIIEIGEELFTGIVLKEVNSDHAILSINGVSKRINIMGSDH